MKKLRVSRRARDDLKAALRWYHDRDPLVSRRFLQAVNGCVARIEASPRSFPLQAHGARRLLVPKFPYGIYYSEDDDGITLIALVHSHRHPDAWRSGSEGVDRRD